METEITIKIHNLYGISEIKWYQDPQSTAENLYLRPAAVNVETGSDPQSTANMLELTTNNTPLNSNNGAQKRLIKEMRKERKPSGNKTPPQNRG